MTPAAAWIRGSYLVDRLRQPRTRAEELKSVRLRLAAQPSSAWASDEEKRHAVDLRQLREALDSEFPRVRACSHCVRPRCQAWPGGHCCSARTSQLFTDEELGALRLSGTSAWHLTPPRSSHNGCAFRGPNGCSLDPRHRPNLCVRYTCLELEAELRGLPRRQAITRLQQKLKSTFGLFVAARSARRQCELEAEIAQALRRAGLGREGPPRVTPREAR